MPRKSLDDLRELATRVLGVSGTAPGAAATVARALVRAEADGLASHGLARLPVYAGQVRAGKVDGRVEPELTETGSAAIRVDALGGFAYPAIRLGLDRAAEMIAEAGTVAVAIGNSHHAGVVGHQLEDLAERGLAALGFTNSPAAIAPAGGNRALFGTNPIAFACPRRNGPPIVIDTSLSRVARGRIKLAADRGDPIPETWAIDPDGNPTTDAAKAMQGAMLPIGGAKGSVLALMVELLCAALTGSNAGFQASSFFDSDGPPPGIGQFYVVFRPDAFDGGGFAERVEDIAEAITGQPGARLPGGRRLDQRAQAARDGVEIADGLYSELQRLAAD